MTRLARLLSLVARLFRDKAPGRCRECGCGEFDACPGDLGGCYWVEPGLCSGCAPEGHPGLIRTQRGEIIR